MQSVPPLVSGANLRVVPWNTRRHLVGCPDARRRRGSAMRLLLVVNAFASSVTARNRVLIEQALSQVAQVEVRETNRRGHATRFAHDATLRGIDVVAALGGDGT